MFCPGCGMMCPGMGGGMAGGGMYGGGGGVGGPWWGGGYGQGMGMGPGMGPWYTGGYGTATLPTDTDIQTMVYNNLDNDPLIPWDANINVEVDAGEVTLSGDVPSKRVKHAAGDDAWWVPGVTDVHNTLKIKKPERQGKKGGEMGGEGVVEEEG